MSAPSFSSFLDLPLNKELTYSSEKSRSIDSKTRRKKTKHKRLYNGDPPNDSLENKKARGVEQDLNTLHSPSNFFSDVKGDVKNVEYGSLHFGDVPKYQYIDRRIIFGLSHPYRYVFRGGKSVEIGFHCPRKMLSLTDSSSNSLLFTRPFRRLIKYGDAYSHHEVDGFIKLPSSSRKSNSKQTYCPLKNSKVESDCSSDYNDTKTDEELLEDQSGEMTLTASQAKIKDLEILLSQDSESVDDWLNLLVHCLSMIPITSNNAKQSRSEVTLSVLSRCFAANARNSRSELLRLLYMKAGEEIWHESKLKAEWESALEGGGVEIWLEWLEWRIRKADKGVQGIVDDAVMILSFLGQGEQDEITKVRVVWRVAVAAKNAGFPERATTMFQAQAELTFNLPLNLHGSPLDVRMSQLEEFWASEIPRVGEEGALGWAASTLPNRYQQFTNLVQKEEIMDLDPYRQWAAREKFADWNLTLSSRSFDESDDPYSMVLFSDVQPLLFSLHSGSAKDAFRKAWLSVLGLHMPGFSASLSTEREINWDDRWSDGHIARPSYLKYLFPTEDPVRLHTDAMAGTIIGREKRYSSRFGPLRYWTVGVLSPLDLGVRRKLLGKSGSRNALWGPEDIKCVDVEFVRRIFAQLRLSNQDTEWEALTLAFEATVSITSSLRISKLFLSENESLERWGTHAQLEVLRGRMDDARKVYHAILVPNHAKSIMNRTGAVWWQWTEMEWLSEKNEQAINVILRSVGMEGRSGVTILRCRSRLDDAIEDEVDWIHRAGWINMRGLFELLVGDEPSLAINFFEKHISNEPKNSIFRERLMVAFLTMLYHYGTMLKNPLAPSILRKRVEKAMEEYPANSVVFSLFLEGEKGQGIWGRVRNSLGENRGKSRGVVQTVAEAWVTGWWEKGRWATEMERLRSGLAAAVESERTRGSYIIWRVYLHLEILAGELVRAKKLFFRAIAECPLVKELYLLAFGPLREVFNGEELQQLGDSMVERGIRLRVGLDEALAGWEDYRMVDGFNATGPDIAEDEIEKEIREMRQRVPF